MLKYSWFKLVSSFLEGDGEVVLQRCWGVFLVCPFQIRIALPLSSKSCCFWRLFLHLKILGILWVIGWNLYIYCAFLNDYCFLDRKMLFKSFLDWRVPILGKLFTQIILTGGFPSGWKLSILSPVFKDNCKLVSSNYQPISLLNIASKVYSKFLLHKIGGLGDFQ